jgi:Protein of unknown function (DUF2852)
VLGFVIWWPVGLALLFFTLGSRKMGCWSHSDRFENKMQRMQYKMERMRGRMERRGFGFGGPPSSGNRAFDEYRVETLKRLEEEQTEFKDFLDRLRQGQGRVRPVHGTAQDPSGAALGRPAPSVTKRNKAQPQAECPHKT